MRFRPRFSIRTLAIFITLVCVYLGLWEITKRYGVPDEVYSGNASSPAPLIVRYDLHALFGIGVPPSRHYCLWLFGPTIELPFESTW